MRIEAFLTCLQNIFQLFETMCYQFLRKESTLFTTKTGFSTNSHNIIGRNPSMVNPLLANQDVTPMLIQVHSFHLCESGRARARSALWTCVVPFSEEDSLVTLDRATEYGSWIDFYFLATSDSWHTAARSSFLLQQ